MRAIRLLVWAVCGLALGAAGGVAAVGAAGSIAARSADRDAARIIDVGEGFSPSDSRHNFNL